MGNPLTLLLSLFCAASPQATKPPQSTPPSRSGIGFERYELSDRFYCEGASFADIDRDGHGDVISGPYWYAGPVFVRAHALFEPKEFDPLGYSDNFFAFPYDFNGDDWTDILFVGFPGVDARWLENPGYTAGKARGEWRSHVVFQGVDNESPTFTDLTGDGRPELVFHTGGRFGWAAPNWDKPSEPWAFHPLSPDMGVSKFTHGLGVGDIDGDDRLDLLEKTGWWEQPDSLDGDPLWERHEFPFAAVGGAQMLAFDIDGDRDTDVLTSLAAHGFGLAWYEQRRGPGGKISFERHTILGEDPEQSLAGVQFSELHALALADVNADGLPDVVTGKRWWSHGPKGNLGNGTPDLYWFELVRDSEGARFVPHLIDNDSGVGTQVVAGDVDGDGKVDVVIGNKKGSFVFLQREISPEEVERSRNLDFEQGSLDGWSTTGDAFEGQPVRGDSIAARLPQQSFHQGEFWIGGFELHGDGRTGTLQSTNFVVESRWASFLVGGGAGSKTCIELRLAEDEKLIYRVPGPNYEPMQRVALDLESQLGKRIFIRVVDDAPGGWGHINFDDFQFHDSEPSFEPPEGIPRVLPEDQVSAAGLAPREAALAMDVPDGFRVELIASEPDLHQPIAFTIDAKGRLWVVEAHSYPTKRDPGQGRDRILVFEDPNADGRYERRTVFADNLNLVSGLEVGFGGVWIGAAPELLFIPDRDGDLVPDGPPEVRLDGWGMQDTHETLNAFIWGPDGWLYGCHGVFTHSRVGKPGTPDDGRVPLNAGIWRYHPIKERFEVFAWGTSNPWGVDFDDRGQAFATACVIPHLFHIVQGARYERQAGEHFGTNVFEDIVTIADHRHYIGDTPHAGNRRSNSAGGGHAHCGAMIYLGDSFPAEYRGSIFMNNVHGNRVNRDYFEHAGSGFVGLHGDDFLVANDNWFRGINLKSGPNGSVYLIDWYDEQACHDTEQENWDRSSGRLFRVSYGEHASRLVDLRSEQSSALVMHQLDANEWSVRRARLILQERGPDSEVHTALVRLLREEQDEARCLRLLWALHATRGIDEPFGLELLGHRHEAVRAWTVQLLCEDDPTATAAEYFAWMSSFEASPIVRLYLASALQRLDSASCWSIARGLVGHGEDLDDPNLPLVLWYGIERLFDIDPVRALGLIEYSNLDRIDRFLVRRAANESSSHAALVSLLRATTDDETREWMLAEFSEALSDEVGVDKPAGWAELYAELDRASPVVREEATWLSVRFGESAAFPDLRGIALDGSRAVDGRIRAIEALVLGRDEEFITELQLFAEAADPVDDDVRSAAIRGLASFDHGDTSAALLRGYASMSEGQRASCLQTLSSRVAYSLELLRAVETGLVSQRDIDAVVLRNLENLDDDEVDALVAKSWGVWRTTPEDKARQIEALAARLTPDRLATADLSGGREVFARTCAQCHVLFGTGGDIGPELTGSNRRNVEYLLTNMVDPSAVIGRDYQVTVLETVDGRIVTGIQKSRSETAYSFVSTTETVVVAFDEIEELVHSKVSMMPEGQLDTLTDDEIRDLVAYLGCDNQVPRRATPSNMGSFFDGTSLAGWRGNTEVWSVEDGEIVGRTLEGLSRNEFLRGDLSLADFRLTFEVKLVENLGNSGVQFRSRELDHGEVAGYQADIGIGWWGKLYEEHGRAVLSDTSGEAYVKPGAWNAYEIRAVGNHLRTWINGGACVDLEDADGVRQGIIALQVHSGGPTEVRFRNFQLELDPE